MTLTMPIVCIIAAGAMFIVSAPAAYKLPSTMRDETAVRTPEMYLLGAFLGWSLGLLLGLFVGDVLGTTFPLLPSLAGGGGGLVGTTFGIAVRAIVNYRRERAAKK